MSINYHCGQEYIHYHYQIWNFIFWNTVKDFYHCCHFDRSVQRMVFVVEQSAVRSKRCQRVKIMCAFEFVMILWSCLRVKRIYQHDNTHREMFLDRDVIVFFEMFFLSPDSILFFGTCNKIHECKVKYSSIERLLAKHNSLRFINIFDSSVCYA